MRYAMRLSALALALAGCGDGSSITDTLPKGNVLFAHAPIDLSGVEIHQPMGEPNVLPRDHGGFGLLSPYAFPPSVPVIALAGGVIVTAQRGTRVVPEFAPEPVRGRSYDDWGLFVQVSSTMRANYGHVTALHPTLMAALGGQPADETGHNVSVPIAAGDTIGWVGPHPAMDFSITDFTLNLSFLNPSRYPDEHIYRGNIFDYFSEPVRTQMLALASRDIPPFGGKHDYDVEGRIVGNWFLEGTTSTIQWSRQLAIVYDHLKGNRVFISDGSPMRDVPGFEGPGAPDIWWVVGNAPRPETVGVAEGIVQYKLISPAHVADELKTVQGVMLVQMIESGRIRVEIFKGVTEAEGFTAAAKVYVR